MSNQIERDLRWAFRLTLRSAIAMKRRGSLDDCMRMYHRGEVSAFISVADLLGLYGTILRKHMARAFKAMHP